MTRLFLKAKQIKYISSDFFIFFKSIVKMTQLFKILNWCRRVFFIFIYFFLIIIKLTREKFDILINIKYYFKKVSLRVQWSCF